MASFERDPSGSFIIRFRHAGKVYKRSLRLANEKEASRVCDTIEATVADFRRGRVVVPPAADVATFFISGGRTDVPVIAPEKKITLGSMFSEYRAKLTAGSKERNSLVTEEIHARHLCRHFGDTAPVARLAAHAEIQDYVDGRAKQGGVARATIRKEINTLRFVTRWATNRGLIRVDPCASWKVATLTFPKETEKLPFQTWDQIARQAARGNLTEDQQADLWECLWLNQEQTVEVVAWAATHTGHPWLLPMIAVAAYTGARRSEILRSEVDDWDFDAGQVAIRQKKSDKSKTFTRRFVPIHPDLARFVRLWLASRSGTSSLLIVNPKGEPLSISQSAYGFRLAVTGTKWSVLRGYHVLRHSFASNLASRGIDQRIIDELLGHSTAEMSRRYRHLAPDKKRAAVETLYTQHSAIMDQIRPGEISGPDRFDVSNAQDRT